MQSAAMFIEASVSKSTLGKYKLAWTHWVNFTKALGVKPFDSQSVKGNNLALLYLAYCAESKGFSPSTVGVHFAGISFFFRKSNASDSFFHTQQMEMARSGLRLLHRKLAPMHKTVTTPVSLEMILRYRSLYRFPTLRQRCTFVACITAFVFLLRISEYVELPSDHFLRVCDVLFHTPSGKFNARNVFGLAFSSVFEVTVFVRSAKNDSLGFGNVLSSKPTPSADICICKILFDWALIAGFSGDVAPFCSFGNQSLRPNDVGAAIKEMAISFGFSSNTFSPHSLRYGGATTLATLGFSDSVIMKRGRWKSSAFLTYIKSSTGKSYESQITLSKCSSLPISAISNWATLQTGSVFK
jgi:hypothetical protein